VEVFTVRVQLLAYLPLLRATATRPGSSIGESPPTRAFTVITAYYKILSYHWFTKWTIIAPVFQTENPIRFQLRMVFSFL